MRVLVALFVLLSTSAWAHTHHRHHHYHHAHRGGSGPAVDRHYSLGGYGLVTVQTAANPITVASDIADQMRSLIADLVARGYRGYVHCFDPHGHVPGSRHHSGHACDFAQLRRNVVPRSASIMYHAGDLIRAHGLRDGCSFRDCGHVDDGRSLGIAHHRHRGVWRRLARSH